jgi:hypothetical protein
MNRLRLATELSGDVIKPLQIITADRTVLRAVQYAVVVRGERWDLF